MSKFSVILADPPWRFDVWNRETGLDRSADRHYETMTIDEICALPIANLTEKDCVLFMWAIWPRIFEAKKVIEAWGFTYRALAWEWIKLNKSGRGVHMGLGYYTRANVEPCLLAVKGNMSVMSHAEHDLIFAPVSRHSEKPIEQYSIIKRLYPEGRRVELFARQQWTEWEVWGQEVGVTF
jgi:N6-adenosine-specific RNA methylase IME4